MKRTFYSLIILLVLFGVKLNAQVSVGFFGGVNFADLNSDLEIIESTSKLGMGALIEYQFNDELSLLAEPMYLQKGGLQPESIIDPEININLAYIELPVLLKYKFNFSEMFKPYLIAGPTAGYRLSADMHAEMSGVAFSAELKESSIDFDFGISFGAGLEIPIESIYIFIEGKYNLGLIDLHKNGTFYATDGINTMPVTFTDENWYKTKGLQFTAGFKFPIGS